MGKKLLKKRESSNQKTSQQVNNFKYIVLLLVVICTLIPIKNYINSNQSNHDKKKESSSLKNEFGKSNDGKLKQTTANMKSSEDDDSSVGLIDFLDSYLTTSLHVRPSVSIETIHLLLQETKMFDLNQPIIAKEITQSQQQQGTGGELTLLGYGILLHDVQFVEELLFPKNEKLSLLLTAATARKGLNPMAYVGIPPNIIQGKSREGMILGSFHEAALGDGFRPLHLALMTKDIAVDAARKFLLRASSQHGTCSTLSSTNSDNKEENLSDFSLIGKMLLSLSPCHNNTDHDIGVSSVESMNDGGGSIYRNKVTHQELVDEIHNILIEPMLSVIFKAIKTYPILDIDSDSVRYKMILNNAVITALRTRDRWGRTPLHLAVLSGNKGACKHIMREWNDAIINIKMLEQDKNDGKTSQSSDDQLPIGFECWLLGSMDQLNRTSLHYAAMRGDEDMLKLLMYETSPMHTSTSRIPSEVLSNLESCSAIAQIKDVNKQSPEQLLVRALHGHISQSQDGEIIPMSNSADETQVEVEVDNSLLKKDEVDIKEDDGVKEQEVEEDDNSGGWSNNKFIYDNMKLNHHRECDVQVIDVEDMTPKRFLLEFLSSSQPVLIKGAAKDWKFRTQGEGQWNKERFTDRFGDFQVLSSSIPYASSFGLNHTQLSMKTFIHDHLNNKIHSYDVRKSDDVETTLKTSKNDIDYKEEDVAPEYVFTDRPHAKMLRDFPLTPSFMKIAKHLIDPIPASIQFFIGPVGSGSPWHWHGDAWNAIAYGEKRWSLLPPGKAVFSNKHSYHTHFDLSINNSSGKGVVDALHCVQEAGDVIYVPSGWAHTILNTKETLGVAAEFRYTFNHFV